MGLVLTIVYIVLTIISPEQFGPAWANYHMLVYLAVITTLFSLPNVLSRSSLLSSVQTYLLLGLIVMVGVSQIANHWLGGALNAWLAFLPSAAVYFFIVANVNTLRHLKIVIFACIAACLGLVAEAFWGYYAGFLGNTFFIGENVDSAQAVHQIIRLRAVGFLHDPNDFSQMLIIMIALLFVAWRQGRIVSNTVLVLAPATVFLWAVYLTHSRGALIGLAVLALMAGYKRIGRVAALAMSGILGLGLMALDFTGGRAIDPSAGGDRLELWAEGLEAFKHSPIFGIGFGNIDLGGHTAHNSFVLPLAELGIIGAAIWVALLVTTMLALNRVIALREASAAERSDVSPDSREIPAEVGSQPALEFSFASARAAGEFYSTSYRSTDYLFGALADPYAAPLEPGYREDTVQPPPELLPMPKCTGVGAEISAEYMSTPLFHESSTASSSALFIENNPLAILRAALVAFMVTAWFLSRTYDTTIYLVLGLAVAAANFEPAAADSSVHRGWIRWTLAAEATLMIFIYLIVRLRH